MDTASVGGQVGVDLSVTHRGGDPVVPGSPELAGPDEGDFTIGAETCSSHRLTSGEACSISVRFAPSAPGRRVALLRLPAGAGTLSTLLVGLGRSSRLVAGSDLADLGTALTGMRTRAAVELRNAGEETIRIQEIEITGRDAKEFDLAGGCAPRALDPGSSCTVRVTFAPTAAGERRATLRVASDALEAPTVELRGVGQGRDQLELTPPELAFGPVSVGASLALVVQVRNAGAEPVSLSEVRFEPNARDFRIEGGIGCPDELTPGASCDLPIIFAPAEASERTSSLVLTTTRGEHRVSVSGLGAAPHIVTERASLELPSTPLGTESRLVVVLENQGTGPGRMEPRVSGAQSSPFSIAGCTDLLAPGETCTLTVSFRPLAPGPGGATANLAPDGPRLSLTGTGLAPRLSADLERLDFGRLPLGERGRGEVRIHNGGTAPGEAGPIRLEGAAAAFALVEEGCGPEPVPPGGHCTIVVEATPRREGPARAELVVGDSVRVELLVDATAARQPRLEIRPLRIDFPSQSVGARSEIATIELRNSGTGPLHLGTPRLEGASPTSFRLVPGSCSGATFVAAGGSCTIGVRFEPATPGLHRADLEVEHDGGSGTARVVMEGEASTRPPP